MPTSDARAQIRAELYALLLEHVGKDTAIELLLKIMPRLAEWGERMREGRNTDG